MAVRAFEATIVALEQLHIPYQYIDSKEWQKALLPKGCKGKELKKASHDIATRLFPVITLKKNEDADGLLIAEYAKRKGF